MIKVSHESPLALLESSLLYNDYDYALVHLFETEPAYLKFFEESVDLGRHVLLDNSIFELGKAFDSDRYAYWINTLKPTEYIIPDVLEDSEGTIKKGLEFIRKHNNLPGKTIGVVQGRTYEEIKHCYRYMDCSLQVNKIAISFDYSYYREVFPHPNKWVSFMMGRVLTLTHLMNDGIINKNKPHHLLGCAHPREFSFYSGPEFSWIDSLDTSSPVVHGLKGIKYADTIGNWQKESTKLVDLLHSSVDDEQWHTISYNVGEFKKYLL